MNLDPVLLAELQRGGPPLWVSGRTYPAGYVARSPANLQPYVRIAAGSGATDPSGDTANWLLWSKRIEDAVSSVSTAVGNMAATVAKAADVSAVGTSVGSVSSALATLAGKVDSIKATVDGSGIKSVQRGMFAGIQVQSIVGFYDLPISTVNASKSTLNLLTTEWPGYGGNQSVTLRTDGAAVRIYAQSGGGNYTNFPAFSWEVTEWMR
ncbi:hypothetical protein M4R23_09160 [Acidovorax sp. GBBC 3332]|nr:MULTISPECIES: hypothetical protein [unclassified Acidovorax]MDA8449852.1 hypothetical protein [Acidovorax sp. GBBC 3297]MDA8459297.1 hypothetical protein [Acidovorax sp. GBBC 3333]MDA8464334.1 hypothetical protein [Acidovorax sp. GBBC 3332]MDA8469455.1 hypothetical protein [Acidovorax sp. GBBC 3299]